MSYARTEFKERAHRLYAPVKAMSGNVKVAIQQLHADLEVHMGRFSEHRARELWIGRAKPTVEEIDFLRVKDGVWCNRMKRAKAAVEDKIEDIWEFVTDLKRKRQERKLSKQSFIGRAYAHHDDRA